MGIKRKANAQNLRCARLLPVRRTNPEALEVLCDEELRALRVGDYVKISNGNEYCWVKLTFIDEIDLDDSACDAVCIGVVDIVPVSGALKLGEQIRFNAGIIVQVYI